MEITIDKKLKHFLPTQKSIHFVIIGTGGTGGYLIPNLARQIALSNEGNDRPNTLTLIDEDIIEEKNLIRQNFVFPDIGKNKAEVLAKRYGRSFGLEIGVVPKYMTNPNDLLDVAESLHAKNANTPRNRQNFILVDCTDNNKTRLLIKEAADALAQKSSVVFLSSGNEERAGQVICSFKPKRVNFSRRQSIFTFRSEMNGLFTDASSIFTPDFFDVFPNSDLEKLPTELSCAEAAVSAPQNISANITAATILFNYCNSLLAGEGITALAVFFDTKTLAQKIYYSSEKDTTALLSHVANNGGLPKYKKEGLPTIQDEDLIHPPTWADVQLEYENKRKEAQEELDKLFA